MAYFEPSIDADGIHIPTYTDIMDYLVGKYKEIFGDDVYIGEETKDYQILSIFAKCMDDYSALVVDSYNARNPNYAEGDSLDLLLPLVSMRRREATPSTVVLKLSGDAGTIIEEGKVVIDKNGNLWNLDSGATLDEDGEAEVNATCDVRGAISAPIGTIDQIFTPVIGWNEVTNEEAAKVGQNTETDDEVRLRRRKSVNVQNNGSYDAIVRALMSLDVDGDVVTFASVLANDSNSTDVNGIPAHNICCVVDGMDEHDDLIAEAIWKSKAPGIGTYGGPEGDGRRSITYVDVYGHSNTVNFARPVVSPVTVVVYVNALSGYDSDRVVPMIKAAVEGGINDLGIGNSWGVTTAYRDIYNAFTGEQCPFVITSITGETSSMLSESTTEVPCVFNEVLNTDDDHITIVVNA